MRNLTFCFGIAALIAWLGWGVMLGLGRTEALTDLTLIACIILAIWLYLTQYKEKP